MFLNKSILLCGYNFIFLMLLFIFKITYIFLFEQVILFKRINLISIDKIIIFYFSI